MLLAIDVGNSDVVFGLHDQQGWAHTWRIPSTRALKASDYFRRSLELVPSLASLSLEGVVLSSVVPDLTPTFQAFSEEQLGLQPLQLGPDLYVHMEMGIDHPEEIGSDLVANAVAAWDICHQACIVVDFGTALSFTVVVPPRSILGVTIAPGLKTAVRALFLNAAQLDEVPLELPPTAIGKTTPHAIQAGVLLGYVGLVNSLLDQMEVEIGMPCQVIATGGLAQVLRPLKQRFDHIIPTLTLDGLRLIFEAEKP